jgi:hypothetical protein
VLDLAKSGAQLPQVMKQAGLAIDANLGKQRDLGPLIPGAVSDGRTILDVWHAVDGAKEATTDWSKELANLAHTFEVLGISADSGLGKVLGGLTAGQAALSQWNSGGGLKGLLSGKGGISGILGQVGAGIQMGVAAFNIGKSIVGLFTSSPAERAAKEAGQLLGMKVSKELAESILKTSKDLHVSIDVASLLNLDKAMAEANKPAAEFAGQVSKLMEGIASGSIPAKQGLEQVGKAFTSIKDEAIAAGHVGDAVMVGLIRQARELGTMTPEMSKFVMEQVDLAISGLDRMIGAMTSVSAAGAQDQATIFAATFQAALAEKGLVGAVEALSPMFDKLKEQLAGMGDSAVADAILAPFQRLHDLMGNELFAGAANAAAGLKDILTGLANAGYLDVQTFLALQNQAVLSFGVMTDQGATSREALLTLAPTIQAAISAAQQFGVPLSADMQHLRDMAEQAGITFKTDPMERMATALEAIAVKLGALPASILQVGNAFAGINPPTINIPYQFVEVGGGLPGEPGEGGGGGHPGGGGGHFAGGHASGFDAIARSDGYLKFHRGERVSVVPAGDSPMSREIAQQVAAQVGRGGDSGGDGGSPVYHVTVPLTLDGRAMGQAVFELSKDGRLRITSDAVVEH